MFEDIKNQKPRTIAFVSGYSIDLPAIKNRLKPFIKESLKRNFEVILISPTKSNLQINHKNLKEYSLNREIENKKGFYMRAFNEISSSYLMMRKVYENEYDYVLIGIPSIFNLLFVKPIPKKTQFIDIRDVAWEYLKDNNLIEKFVKQFFRWVVRIKFKNFNTIIITNKGERNYFIDRFRIPKNKLYLLSNGIEQERFSELSISEKKEKNKNKNISISYIGNIGVAQNLDTLLIAAKNLPDIEFNIVGSGRNLKSIKRNVYKYNLKNVKIHGRLNWDELLEIYKKTDILYAQLSEEFNSAIPSKLYEYLASGKLIIYGGVGEAIAKLKEFENVFLIKPNKVDILVSTINKIIEKKHYQKLSSLNKKIIKENYIREKEMKKFFDKHIK